MRIKGQGQEQVARSQITGLTRVNGEKEEREDSAGRASGFREF